MGARRGLRLGGCAALSVLGLSCSEDSAPQAGAFEPTPVGGLARFADDDASTYFELVVRPDDAAAESVDAVLTRIGGRPESIDAARDRIVATISSVAPVSETPDWAEDVEPWLGDRLAVFGEAGVDLATVAADGDVPDVAVAIRVADPELAEQALDRLLSDGLETSESEAVRIFAAGEETAVALTDDAMVLGEREAVELALDAEQDHLADDTAFADSLTDVETEPEIEELAFTIYAGSGRFERDFVEGAGPRFGALLGPEPLDRLGVDEDQPFSFELGVAGDEVVFDFTYGPSRDPHLERLREFAAGVPEATGLLIADPLVMPALWKAIEVGIAARLEGRARRAGVTESELSESLGYDLAGSIEAIGERFVLYATTGSGADSALGLSAAIEPGSSAAEILEVAEGFVVNPPSPGTTAPLAIEPPARAFSFASPLVAQPGAVAEFPDRVNVAIGASKRAASQAVSAGRGAVAPLRERDADLGGEYLSLGYADLSLASIVLASAFPEAGVPLVSPEQGGYLSLGGRYDEEVERLSLRVRVTPPQIAPEDGPLERLLPDDDAVASAAATPPVASLTASR